MRLDELSGEAYIDPRQAASLVQTLFEPSDMLSISSKRAERIKGSNVFTQMILASELVSDLLGPQGKETLFSMCTLPTRMDTYFGLAPIRPQTYRGMNKRVREEDVDHLGLVYADLDVKEGSFNSQQEAMNFLGSLDYRPNVVVASGSGGLHAYWRITGFSGPKSINVQVGKDLLVRWWAYLCSKSHGRRIDKLVDVTRMSRLPGTIRWPKEGTDEQPKPVTLLRASRVESIRALELLDVTEDAWKSLETKRATVRKRDEEMTVNIEQASKLVDGGKWAKMLAIASVDEWVSQNVTWDSILVPFGWTFLREDGQERREWARPGQEAKSATTDWPDSPDVMSLLSTSYDTGLSDLHDADIPLTKWRVMLRLNFNDDADEAIRWVLGQMGMKM